MLKYGKWVQQVVAVISLLSIILYITITYSDEKQYPTYVANWYLNVEKMVVMSMFVMYMITWYIQSDRAGFIKCSFSITCLLCIVPIFAF